MKHFRLILFAMWTIFALLLSANVIFMVQLYDSIKERYVSDVEQAFCRADQIEMVDRIVDAGLGDEDDVLWLRIGLRKTETNGAMSAEELRELDYSQGFRRVDRQLLSVIAGYLHDIYGDLPGSPDFARMEESFRRDLAFSDFYPEEVHIVDAPGDDAAYMSHLWEIRYDVGDDTFYYAYISPLTSNILGEMCGVIVTSALVALVLTAGFRYLLHVIRRLRTIEEMKDDFTANMTHELKTPIAIAYAANDSLLQFPAPEDEERTRKYLSAALEQLSRLSALVESILAMSMERRRHFVMEKERINLRPFLSAVIDQQKMRAAKPCEITLTCPMDAVVDADPVHFSNVIANLVDNSIKYSDDTVSIAITADCTRLSVADDGMGIPAGALSEIFNRFYRVPHGNRRDVGGYGIGLCYVKSIVDKHGWSIAVESRYGKGSKFTIHFNE